MLLGFVRSSLKPSRAKTYGHSTGKQLFKALIILALLLISHSAAMVFFEGLSIGDSIWLTMTSATTVGYGDLAAKTFAGRFSTIILLYVGGIAILAQVAAMYFEFRNEIRENKIKGKWRWKMKNHIVFLNCPKDVGEEFFYKAIFGMRKSNSPLHNLPIVVVSDKFDKGISHGLRKLNVVHVSKHVSETETLEDACVKDAHTIVILAADRDNPDSDSINFELVDRVRDMGVKSRIIVEVARDENRVRMKRIGANNTLRPIRAYPELLIRAILAPGSEQVIETLFNSFGEECIRYDVNTNCSWLEIIQKMTTTDLGIPVAYEDLEGKIINNPSSKAIVQTKAVFAIVNEHKIRKSSEIEKIINSQGAVKSSNVAF
jgi:voltage-gated potassium channel